MKASKERLYSDVEFLTTIRPFRNYRNMQTLNKVCNYIRSEFEKAGGTAEEQKWMADGHQYKNILTSYNPEKSKRLVVGAHYDVAGDQPGADDNGSAVAGLLETVRLVFANKPEIDYRIDFVAYCLEEPPYFATNSMGSYIHAKSLYDANVDVLGMICYEMIGYFSDDPGSQPYPSPELAKLYPDVANYIVVVGIKQFEQFNLKLHKLMKQNAGIDVQVISFPSSGDLAGLSDQRNYWKFGWQALMINDTAFVRNPNYHRMSDTIDTLDFPKMTEVINCAYNAIVNII